MLTRAPSSQASEQAEQAFRSRDAYESAAAQAVLILLWIGVLRTFGPALPWPIGTLLLVPAGLGILGLAYFIGTWRRPKLSVALTFSLVELLLAAVLIAWAGWIVVPSGRTWEPVAAAQLAIASIPLVAPPFLWLGFVLVVVFAAELSAIVLYPHHLGLGPVPVAEPYISLTLASTACVVLLMREQRRRLGIAHIRTQTEVTALSRLSPLFVSVREQLNEQISALVVILRNLGQERSALTRSVERLATLSGSIEALESRTPEPAPQSGPTTDAERLLLAKDSQAGAAIYALACIGNTLFALWGLRSLPVGSTLAVLWCGGLVYATILAWVLVSWRRPTTHRGVIASLLLFFVGAFVLVYVHVHWVRLSPAFPYVGYKLGLIGLVILRPVRLWLGLTWLAVLTIESLTLQLVLAPVAHPPPLEPWHTILIALLAVGLFFMGEHRRVASIALLRAEVEASSLRRRVNLFLALSDRMNTPLQTLVMQLGLCEQQLPHSEETAELRLRIERLCALSQRLRQVGEDVPSELQRGSFDAADELRHLD